MFAGHLEPLLRILGRADLMTLLGKQQGTTLAHDLFVIDNQNRCVFHVDLPAFPVDRLPPSRPQGIVTVNVVPAPGPLSTAILPPCASMIPCVTAKPNPVPCPTSLEVKNGSKILRMILRRDADAGIAEDNLHRIAADARGGRGVTRQLASANHELTTVGHRFTGIYQQIHKHLLHLAGIHQTCCDRRIIFPPNLDRREPRLMFHQGNRLLEIPGNS